MFSKYEDDSKQFVSIIAPSTAKFFRCFVAAHTGFIGFKSLAFLIEYSLVHATLFQLSSVVEQTVEQRV